ncbi:MAG: helix-turn-helix domain-containing protein [Armatimonadota bacterium]
MTDATWFDTVTDELQFDLDYLTDELAFGYINEIKRAMKCQQLTQSELAKRMGKSRAYVSRLLNYSANMTLRSLALIGLALGGKWEEARFIDTSSRQSAQEYEIAEPLRICITYHHDFGLPDAACMPVTIPSKGGDASCAECNITLIA